ncbi:hypothetical protein R3P38DRAFT_2891471 [Favolaschia claudopus]|uniref:Uncharacterized protein n=1 Tax=Favolaschia claudopus TaxID=2862362 RepID=A0AAW0CU73_9AGAR
MTTEAAGTVAHPQVAQSSHLFHNASDFEIFGGHYILGDVHNHHEAPRLPPENPLSFAEEEAFSDSDIYCGQMLRKRRGFPLYEPAPQANLPAAYQTHGVSIGDVGSITSEGMFDFFFNIFLPSDHPINGSRTPTGFSPTQLYEAIDVSHFDYDPASHVSTSSVQRLDVEVESSDPPGDDFIFDCDAPQGAILALPHGAHLKKLRNVDHIRTYAAKHAANWYEYINGPRGRGLANGELYIVTGCEKAPSWGMASYHASRQDFQLKFNRGVGIPNTQFRWSGTPGQKNPSQRKHYNRPLGENQPSNHTTFVHGLSVSIGKRLWKKLFGTVPVESSSIARFFNSKNGSSAGVSSKSSPGSFLRNFFGAGRSPSSRGNGTGRQHGGVVFSNVAPIDGLVYNPSRLINEYILTKIPETTIAISHDDDWSDILSEVSEVDSPEIFLHHIEGQFGIMGSDGPTFPLSKAAYTTARFAALTSDNSFNTSGFTPENISRPFPSPPTVSGDISLDGLQSLKYTFRQIEPRGVMSKEREGDYTVGNVSNNDAASQRRMLSMPSRNGSAARRKMPVLKHRRLQPKDVAPPHPSYDSPMPTSSFLPIHAPEQRLQPQDVALPHISYDSSIMPTFSSLPGYAYAPQVRRFWRIVHAVPQIYSYRLPEYISLRLKVARPLMGSLGTARPCQQLPLPNTTTGQGMAVEMNYLWLRVTAITDTYPHLPSITRLCPGHHIAMHLRRHIAMHLGSR